MDEALAKLEREVARDPSDVALLRALAAAKQRVGWTYAGRGLEHWIAQLSVEDWDVRDHRVGEAFRSFGIAGVPTLLDAMAAGVPEAATAALYEIGPQALFVAVPALRRLASTAQGELRRNVLSLLLSHRTSLEDVFDLFEREVIDPDEEVRLDALHFIALHDPTPTSAIPHLVVALRDPAPRVRHLAARLLSRVVDPRVRQHEVVEALLSQDRSGGRAPGEPTFETVAGHDAIPAFVAATSSSDPLVRRRALRLLAVQQHGNQRDAVAARFMEALADDDRDVRNAGADGLRHLVLNGLDPMHAASAVLATLGDAAPDRRADAAWALSAVGYAAVAVPALTRALDDRDADVRRVAALALAERGEEARPALPRLLALLDDADDRMRRNVPVEIVRIGVGIDQLDVVERLLERDDTRYHGATLLVRLGVAGVNLAPTVLGWLVVEGRPEVRRRLADALLAMGQSLDVAVSALLDGVPYDPFGDPSFALGERLAQLIRGDPTVMPALFGLLTHSSSTIRIVAAHALATVKAGDAPLRTLLDLLAAGSDPHDRARAARALRLDDASVIAALTRALEDDAKVVAIAAADTLESLAAAAISAAQALERAIASDDPDLSWAARRALDAVLAR